MTSSLIPEFYSDYFSTVGTKQHAFLVNGLSYYGTHLLEKSKIPYDLTRKVNPKKKNGLIIQIQSNVTTNCNSKHHLSPYLIHPAGSSRNFSKFRLKFCNCCLKEFFFHIVKVQSEFGLQTTFDKIS